MRRALPFLLLVGCSQPAVTWSDPQAALGDTLGALRLQSVQAAGYSKPEAVAPPDPAACLGSAARANAGDKYFAAWLHARPDSSVAVMAAAYDRTQWSRPATVDSLDVGRFGCSRPGPSIAFSDVDGYVHVAYSVKAPEGYGVFFAHSMDRALTFHSPMIIVYGDRLSNTAVAAAGSEVVVAYEVPSGSVKRIDIAISRTQGHTFEPRESASPDEMVATLPRIALFQSTVALTFAGADSAQRTLRLGTIRQDH
jgi:hypothetical protein